MSVIWDWLSLSSVSKDANSTQKMTEKDGIVTVLRDAKESRQSVEIALSVATGFKSGFWALSSVCLPEQTLLEISARSISDQFSKPISSILAPIAGGPHIALTTKVPRAITNSHDTFIELLHAVTPGEEVCQHTSEDIFTVSASLLDEFDNDHIWLPETETGADTNAEQSQCCDRTVTGAPRTPPHQRLALGPFSKSVQENVSNSVLPAWI